MREKICVTTANYKAFVSAHAAAIGRAPGVPGIVLAHGGAGNGKTFVSANIALKQHAIFVTAVSIWNPRWMLGNICGEMGMKASSFLAPMFEFIVRELTEHPRPIYVDEADAIAEKKELVETLRTLHDLTAVPLVLIGGTAEFRGKMLRRPHIERRIVREVEFKPNTLDDSRLMAAELAEVRLADDLIEELHRKSRGSAGLLVKELAAAEAFCRRHGLNKIALADYPMDDSTPPPVNTKRADFAAAA